MFTIQYTSYLMPLSQLPLIGKTHICCTDFSLLSTSLNPVSKKHVSAVQVKGAHSLGVPCIGLAVRNY